MTICLANCHCCKCCSGCAFPDLHTLAFCLPAVAGCRKLQPRDSTEDLEKLLLLVHPKAGGSIRQQLQQLQQLQQPPGNATAEHQPSNSSSQNGASFKFAPIVPPTVPQLPVSVAGPHSYAGGLQRGIWDAQAALPAVAWGAEADGQGVTGAGPEPGVGQTSLAPVPEDQEFGNMVSVLIECGFGTQGAVGAGSTKPGVTWHACLKARSLVSWWGRLQRAQGCGSTGDAAWELAAQGAALQLG